uniref:Alpha-tocopherol transfer protein-like isoform X1 n=1 Tax=Diabrotica virgifera virgifera TaxID=50390 RepID=A0A6P7G5V8_DIAVI
MQFNEIAVEEVYRRDEKLKKEDVQALMEWMGKQPHLPKATELQVASFLHSCYYSNEAAKNSIDAYFTVKSLCPDIFSSRTINDNILRATVDTQLFVVLPELTPAGDAVILSRKIDPDPRNFHMIGQLKLMDIVPLLHSYQYGPAKGFQLIIDMELTSLGHLLRINPSYVKKFAYYLQEGMPIRLKQIHFINLVPFMDKVFSFIKPVMKKELIDLFLVHTKMESLYEHIPQKLLPEEYGGNIESILVLKENVRNLIKNSENYLKFQESQLIDESKRQGSSKYQEDLFGAEGSFKKLDID